MEIEALRAEIERIDRALIALINERVELARSIGQSKRAAGIATLDPAREATIIRRSVELARDAGLSEEDVRQIFWHIVGMCRRAQLDGAGQPEP